MFNIYIDMAAGIFSMDEKIQNRYDREQNNYKVLPYSQSNYVNMYLNKEIMYSNIQTISNVKKIDGIINSFENTYYFSDVSNNYSYNPILNNKFSNYNSNKVLKISDDNRVVEDINTLLKKSNKSNYKDDESPFLLDTSLNYKKLKRKRKRKKKRKRN